MKIILGIALLVAAMAVTGAIDLQVAKVEAEERPWPLMDWHVQSVADQNMEQMESVRYAVVSHEPCR